MIRITTDKQIQAMIRKEIQAQQQEGQKYDVLTGPDLSSASTNTSTSIDKNNYKTYDKQVSEAYDMYNAETDYGSEMLGSIIATRISFILGSGISVIGKSSTEKWINEFLEYNKLHGIELFDNGTTGELEGKNLLLLTPNTKDETIRVRSLAYNNQKYIIEADNNDLQKITAAKFAETKQEIGHKPDKFVYVKLGGSPDRINNTPSKIHRIITDIENFSRIKYDLRKNNHLFAKAMAYFKTDNPAAAKSINNDLATAQFTIGKSYAGNADFSIVEPSGRAADALIKEMITSARIISMNTGIPVHWLAYPDLMSNRATAENMLEAVNAATIQERTIWEDAYKELIIKAMVIAKDKGFQGAILDTDFEIKIPLISLAHLKQIQETWIPLAEAGYISQKTVRNRLPGINPSNEERLLKKEKEDRINNSPLQKMVNQEVREEDE